MCFSKIRLTVLLVIFSFCGYTQNLDKLDKKAEDTFFNEDFVNAIPLYREILSIDPDNNNAKYKIELCSLLIHDNRTKPLNVILDYAGTQGRRDKFYDYWLGRIYIMRSEFDEAITSWNAFLSLKTYKSQIIIDETNQLLEVALKAKESYSNPSMHVLTRLGDHINTDNSQLSPTYIADSDQLIYASQNRNDNSLKIFIVDKQNDEWMEPQLFRAFGNLRNGTIDIDYLHPGKLFLKNDNKNILTIERRNTAWTPLEQYNYELPNNRTKSHFAINQAEDRIVFSQMDKTLNLDLYESTKTGDEWSRPSLIENINTSFNEDSPFISMDGNSLYFSSEGHDAIGGFDVMVSTLKGDQWSEPVNMGYPINSIDNELHFSINDAGIEGFFISDRINSKGGFDIYHFRDIAFKDIEGIVTDAATNLAVPDLAIEFRSNVNTNENFNSITNSLGAYNLRISPIGKFDIRIFDGEVLIHEEKIDIKNQEATNIRKDFKVTTNRETSSTLAEALDTNENEQFNEDEYSELDFIANKFRPGERAILENFYFKFGTSEFASSSGEILESLFIELRDNPTLQVEIAGHADSKGDAEFNLRLSEQRATVIYNYLIGKGIDAARLRTIGYGETQPVAADNKESDAMALSRRTEIIVIE